MVLPESGGLQPPALLARTPMKTPTIVGEEGIGKEGRKESRQDNPATAPFHICLDKKHKK